MVRRIAEEYELVKWQHFVRSDPWLKISKNFLRTGSSRLTASGNRFSDLLAVNITLSSPSN